MIKIFKMNSSDWFAAETLEDATQAVADTYGAARPEDLEDYIDNPKEVSDADLDRLTYVIDEGEDERVTFREQLARLIAAGTEFPTVFASTEY